MTSRSPHRRDEFPAEYSLAGCSPAEPASACSAGFMLRRTLSFVEQNSANGNLGLCPCLTQGVHLRVLGYVMASRGCGTSDFYRGFRPTVSHRGVDRGAGCPQCGIYHIVGYWTQGAGLKPI